MARYTGPRVRISRRFGLPIFGSSKYLERRNYGPGVHGPKSRRKHTEYALGLIEKQKLRYYYGLMERQFRNYFEKARKQTGRTGETLVKMLERRLDNTIYRLGFAPSRKAARQMITHGHFLVNDRAVDIPSYLLRPGDVIRVRDRSKQLDVIHASMKRMKDTAMLPWLTLDKAAMTGTFLNVPERADIPLNADEQLIVELYSK